MQFVFLLDQLAIISEIYILSHTCTTIIIITITLTLWLHIIFSHPSAKLIAQVLLPWLKTLPHTSNTTIKYTTLVVRSKSYNSMSQNNCALPLSVSLHCRSCITMLLSHIAALGTRLTREQTYRKKREKGRLKNKLNQKILKLKAPNKSLNWKAWSSQLFPPICHNPINVKC